MERNIILAAFSAHILLAIYFMWHASKSFGFGAVGYALGLAVVIIAAIISGITLFVLRSRQLRWWHALLISIGSIIVASGILMLVVYIADVRMGYR